MARTVMHWNLPCLIRCVLRHVEEQTTLSFKDHVLANLRTHPRAEYWSLLSRSDLKRMGEWVDNPFLDAPTFDESNAARIRLCRVPVARRESLRMTRNILKGLLAGGTTHVLVSRVTGRECLLELKGREIKCMLLQSNFAIVSGEGRIAYAKGLWIRTSNMEQTWNKR